jgi:hypothetical protein
MRAWASAALLCGLLFHAAPGLATDVSIEPALTFIQPGQTATVSVDVTDVPSAGLAGFQVEILFDPAVFAAVDPNAAGPALPFEPAVWFLSSSGRTPLGITAIDNVAGVVQIAYGTEPGPAHPLGSGMLASVEFTAVGSGVSDLTLNAVVLADSSVPPQALPVLLLDAQVSAVAGVTDNDGDSIPENFDGLGLPGDAPCAGGNSASCDDNCPLLANTDQADGNGNGFGEVCEDGWTINGTATGGDLAFQVAGVDLVVLTSAGQSAGTVAVNLAAAINADATLAALGINAAAGGTQVSANTSIDNRMVNDLGLAASVSLPLTIGGLVAGALGLTGALLAGRRRKPGSGRGDEETSANRQRQA